MKDKIILTDIDGVMLDWVWAMEMWLEFNHRHKPLTTDPLAQPNLAIRYGLDEETMMQLVEDFNHGACMGFLPPEKDAQYYVRKLNEKHGYKFIAITSMTSNPRARDLRIRNLTKVFDDGVFEDVVCLDIASGKRDILTQFKETHPGCYWIEDSIENAETGLDLGFDSILLQHRYNSHYKGHAKMVKNWKAIYSLITGDNNNDIDQLIQSPQDESKNFTTLAN